MNQDIDEIKKLYLDLCNASINKDMEMLDKILANHYILVHMTGKRQTKQEYMNSVKTGELAYFESIHENISVNIDKEKATIIGMTKTLAAPFHSGKSWWRLRQDLKAEKIDGKWVLVYSEASIY